MIDLIRQLKRHEGHNGKPYKCTSGKTTIGYGHNLDALPLTEEQSERILYDDVARCTYECSVNVQNWNELEYEVQCILINMCHNLGIVGLMRFKKMFKALKGHDRKEASKEIRDSLYYEQVTNRAEELAQIMEGA